MDLMIGYWRAFLLFYVMLSVLIVAYVFDPAEIL